MEDNICSEKVLNKINYYRKKHLKKSIVKVLFIIFCCLVLVSIYIFKVVNPIILAYGEREVERLLVRASNNAIYNISTINYSDIMTINYDNDNNISSIVADGATLNNISNSLAIETQKSIDMQANLGIGIPLGTCSGISFLAGKGNNLSISINPLGNVHCNFTSKFTSAGINQTLHRIYVQIESEAALILPFSNKVISKQIEYLISECIIIGKIPETYINTGNLDDIFD